MPTECLVADHRSQSAVRDHSRGITVLTMNWCYRSLAQNVLLVDALDPTSNNSSFQSMP